MTNRALRRGLSGAVLAPALGMLLCIQSTVQATAVVSPPAHRSAASHLTNHDPAPTKASHNDYPSSLRFQPEAALTLAQPLGALYQSDFDAFTRAPDHSNSDASSALTANRHQASARIGACGWAIALLIGLLAPLALSGWARIRRQWHQLKTIEHKKKKIELAAAALQAREARARAVIDALPLPIAIVDTNGAISSLNATFTHTFGYSSADLLGWADWWNLSVPDPSERNAGLLAADDRLSRCNKTKQPFEPLALQVHCKDGKHRTVILRITPLEDIGQLHSFVDITEIQQSRDQAEQAARTKSDFLAQMSHEIRTPLNVVLGMAEVLEKTSLDANQTHILRQLRKAGRSLLDILNDILDLSKIEAGQIAFDLGPFRLRDLLDSVERLLAPAARAKGLVLHTLAPPDFTGQLVGDARRLEQIVVNLVGNAIKFTQHGEVRLQINLRELNDAQAAVHIEVIDTGIGISAEQIDGLFAPFTQGDKSIARRFGGTGLGLAICKQLVDGMGGAIGVNSLPGLGSLFWIEMTFPRTNETTPSATLDWVEECHLEGLRLLYVDDSDTNLEVGESLLTLEGAHVSLATNGRQAVEMLRSSPTDFDAVLMDVQMPDMDGLTATRLIRQELGLSDLPIIALTAGVLPEQQQAARAAGMNAVLIKPLDTEQMAAALRECAGLSLAPSRKPSGSPADSSANPFPTLPGIDSEHLRHSLRGNRTLYLRLLERFTQDSRQSLSLARQVWAGGDHTTAAQEMHGLRGDASVIGAFSIMQSATQLEQAITDGDTGLEDCFDALETDLNALIAASQSLCQVERPQ